MLWPPPLPLHLSREAIPLSPQSTPLEIRTSTSKHRSCTHFLKPFRRSDRVNTGERHNVHETAKIERAAFLSLFEILNNLEVGLQV